MVRTIRVKTMRKWLIWLSVFLGLHLGLWISAVGIRYAYESEDGVLPLYWRGLLAAEYSMQAACIILALAWCAVFIAMCVSTTLGIIGMLKDPPDPPTPTVMPTTQVQTDQTAPKETNVPHRHKSARF